MKGYKENPCSSCACMICQKFYKEKCRLICSWSCRDGKVPHDGCTLEEPSMVEIIGENPESLER